MVHKEVKAYMAQIGAEGGKKGGKAGGKRKKRPPEHYAKMVAARKAKRAADSGTVQRSKK
jgi:hypothetical protein